MSEFLLYLDYIGTFVFAVTGATVAARSQYDFFGMLFLAFLTAVGGGTVRDLILDQPVFWTVSPEYLYIIFFATICSLFFKFFYDHINPLIFFLDTLGLGLFAVIGTQKSLLTHSNIETAVIMGTVTGVLGGILRSIFNNEIPIIFKKEIYATTACISAGSFIALTLLGVSSTIAAFIVMVICLFVRYLSVKYNIHLPKAF